VAFAFLAGSDRALKSRKLLQLAIGKKLPGGTAEN
jgi:hypothetical protein